MLYIYKVGVQSSSFGGQAVRTLTDTHKSPLREYFLPHKPVSVYSVSSPTIELQTHEWERKQIQLCVLEREAKSLAR